MKTITFILCLLFLASCGKKNTTGNKTGSFSEEFRADAEIHEVLNTRNGVMVQGNAANFAIPVSSVYRYKFSKHLVAVTYEDRGTRVKVYNALGRLLLDGSQVMSDAIVTLSDSIVAIEYRENIRDSRLVAVNATGRYLINNLSADDIRAKVGNNVVAVTYRRNGVERALAIKGNGQILVSDSSTYVQPRFTIDSYVLVFRHTYGMQEFSL
ncbi:MAG: hypothetical protein V4598_03265 [Bdellovibrionota bacterium]